MVAARKGTFCGRARALRPFGLSSSKSLRAERVLGRPRQATCAASGSTISTASQGTEIAASSLRSIRPNCWRRATSVCTFEQFRSAALASAYTLHGPTLRNVSRRSGRAGVSSPNSERHRQRGEHRLAKASGSFGGGGHGGVSRRLNERGLCAAPGHLICALRFCARQSRRQVPSIWSRRKTQLTCSSSRSTLRRTATVMGRSSTLFLLPAGRASRSAALIMVW
jgi:hypothetical protein